MNRLFYESLAENIKNHQNYTSGEKLNMLTQVQGLARYDTEIGNFEYCDIAEYIRTIKYDCV